jgi:hypothetical protein
MKFELTTPRWFAHSLTNAKTSSGVGFRIRRKKTLASLINKDASRICNNFYLLLKNSIFGKIMIKKLGTYIVWGCG